MIEQLKDQKEELGMETKTNAVADTGYFSEQEIMNNRDNEDCRPIVSAAAEGKKASVSTCGKGQKVPSAEYENDQFAYDQQRDVYICPQHQELSRITNKSVVDRHGRPTHKYRCDSKICQECEARESCTSSEKGRMLRVSANQREMEEYIRSLESAENKKLIAKRKELSEHPYGTLKRHLGFTYFLL